MPIQMLIEREDYKKFKLSDLNLDISENGYASGRLAPESIHEERSDVTIRKTTTGISNYYLISDGRTQVTLPEKLPNGREFQPAIYAIARLVLHASPIPSDYAGNLKSGRPVKLYTKSHIFDSAIGVAKMAEKYAIGGRISKHTELEQEILPADLSFCRVMLRQIQGRISIGD